ncbi:hypothetical protein ACFLXW_00350 [Candidatus Dependentiae bacterium]
MVRTLLALFFISSISAAQEPAVVLFDNSAVRTDGLKGIGTLGADDGGFFVHNEDGMTRIQNCDVDPALHLSPAQLCKFAQENKLRLKQFDNGEFSVEPAGGLVGGGAIGAGIGSALGFGVTFFSCHAVICVVSAATGPFAPATFKTLETMLAVPIHAASVQAGIAGGVAVGVATGPV